VSGEARRELVSAARYLADKSLTHGSTGNLSVRAGKTILVTPTASSLRTVSADDLSTIDLNGRHLDGPPPSKEAFLHAAMLRARPEATAIAHTHSTHLVAISCLSELVGQDAIPPLTAYFVMRVGRVSLVPYFAPGDVSAANAVSAAASECRALLLRNHGPVVAAPDLMDAAEALEEMEETARVFLLLRGHRVQPLTEAQRAALTDSRAASPPDHAEPAADRSNHER
jgi:ribulose-5-phosphate 4-epimerase/fuculose-1-phosphate aldolase